MSCTPCTRTVLRALLVLTASILLISPSTATAQIYAWRDANGALVLSDRKLDPSAKTFGVPDATSYRVTRPVVSRPRHDEYEPIVREHAARQALRPELVRAVIQVESGFNPRARSPKGAMGLMQLMPATAVALGVRNPYDPADNIRGGTMYLRQLIDRYDGNEELALAAYNAGAGAVDRHGRRIPPFAETQDYVKKVSSVDRPRTADTVVSRRVVYKTMEVVNGRPIPRYSSQPPASGSYEIIVR